MLGARESAPIGKFASAHYTSFVTNASEAAVSATLSH